MLWVQCEWVAFWEPPDFRSSFAKTIDSWLAPENIDLGATIGRQRGCPSVLAGFPLELRLCLDDTAEAADVPNQLHVCAYQDDVVVVCLLLGAYTAVTHQELALTAGGLQVNTRNQEFGQFLGGTCLSLHGYGTGLTTQRLCSARLDCALCRA